MANFKKTSEQQKKNFKEKGASSQEKKNFKGRKKRPRKRFLAVDVWQTQFGPVSERAVYDVYAQKFNVESHNMRKYSFPDCVNSLRKLEDPTYKAPSYGSGVVE